MNVKNEIRIYEWNIHMSATIPSNQGYILQPWVVDEIIKDTPDIIVLTEFVVSKGLEYYFKVLESNQYHWFISNFTTQNGIMIAIKESSFDFQDILHYSENSVQVDYMALKGCVLPDFYEVKVKWNEEPLSIIGVRMKVGVDKKQFTALDDYLSGLDNNVICIGDFNAYWPNIWKTKDNHTLPKTSDKYNLYTPPYENGKNFSYVLKDQKTGIGKYVQLDHLITNIPDVNVEVEYYWDFINTLRYKCGITSKTLIKPSGLPDHAILKAIIKT